MNRFLQAVALCLTAAHSGAALGQARDIAADAEQIAEQIARDAEAAAEAATTPEALDQSKRIALQTVDNAMRQLALSESPNLADQLALPEYTGVDEITTALSHKNAWKNGYQNHAEDPDVANLLANFAYNGGTLSYLEWSCHTGAETAIAKQYIDLIPRLVTTYPERLLLRTFGGHRELLGFGFTKNCDSEWLQKERAEYQSIVSRVLKLLARTTDQHASRGSH